MRKNAKRWIAFLLAVIMVATTCMYQSDLFLWATGDSGAVEDTAVTPAEETQVVTLPGNTETAVSTDMPTDVAGTDQAVENPAEPMVGSETPPVGTEAGGQPEDVASEAETGSGEETASTEAPSEETESAEEAVSTEEPEEGTESTEETASTEEPEIAEPEEEPKTEEKPAQTLTAVAEDGATVTVTAPEGALPAGATVTVTVMDPASVRQLIEDAVAADGKTVVSLKVYDVTLWDQDGNEIQPDESVKVTIQGADIQSESADVYHVKDEGNVEKLADSVDADRAEFETTGFSPMVLVETDESDEAVPFAEVSGTEITLETGESVTIECNKKGAHRHEAGKSEHPDIAGVTSGNAGKSYKHTITAGNTPGETYVTCCGTNYKVTVVPAVQKYNVNWYINGESVKTTTVRAGEKPVYGDTPKHSFIPDAEFMGWSTEQVGEKNVSYMAEADLPAVTADVNYYAVFTSLAYFYFVLPGKSNTSGNSDDYMYAGTGSIIVVDGVNSGTRWYTGNERNVEDYILTPPSDEAIRTGLSKYYDGNGGRDKYDPNWSYTINWTTYVAASNATGYDGSYLSNNNCIHVDSSITVDKNTTATVMYTVVRPDTTLAQSKEHAKNTGVEINSTVNESDRITTDGYTYDRIITNNGVEYTFDGWYTDSTYTTKAPDYITVTKNEHFYARYIASPYTLTYNANEGTFSDQTTGTKTGKYENGKLVRLIQAPTRDGYVFAGWLRSDDDSVISAGTTSITMPNQDLTLTAQWIDGRADATIVFNRGEHGAFNDPGKEQITYELKVGDPFPVVPEITADPGWRFTGWSPELPGTDAVVTEDKTYTAQFRELLPGVSVVKTITSTGTAPNGGYWVGDTISYQIVVTNTGERKLQDIAIRDIMTGATGSISNINGAAWNEAEKTFTVSEIAIDKTAIITYDYVIQKDDAGKEIENTASAEDIEDKKEENPDPIEILNPETLTIVSKSDTKDYTGQLQTISGFESGEVSVGGKTGIPVTATDGTTYYVVGPTASVSGTNVGDYTNEITNKDGAYVVDAEGRAVPDGRFVIGYREGILTINKASMADTLKLTGTDVIVTYDGEAHAAGTAVVTKNDVPVTDPSLKIEYRRAATDTEAPGEWTTDPSAITATDAGTVTIDVRVSSSNYSDTQEKTQTITINKRNLVLTSATLEKVYDGKELTNDGAAVTANEGTDEGWAKEEDKLAADAYEFSGGQTLVGSSENTFAIKDDQKKADIEKNYNLTLIPGTLTVTDKDKDNKPVDDGLVITKEHTPSVNDDGKFRVGDTVTFQITVTNIYKDAKDVTLTEIPGVEFAGMADSGNAVTKFFSGVKAFFTGEKGETHTINLAGGETRTVEATYVITEADIVKGSFTNTVFATMTDSEGKDREYKATDTVGNGTDKTEFEKPDAHITLTKTVVDQKNVYEPGDTVTYQIKAVNNGNLTLENIHVEDELVGKTGDNAWTIDQIAPGETKDLGTVTYTVKDTDASEEQSSTLTNTASVFEKNITYGETIVPLTCVDGTARVSIAQNNPSLAIIKEVNRGEDGNGKAGDFAVGEEIPYTITVTNNGSVTVNNITVEDTLVGAVGDNAISVGTLAPGAFETVEVTYEVTEADVIAGSVVNTAAASGTTAAGEPVSAGRAECTVDTAALNTDFTVSKQIVDKKDEYKVGETIQYQITVTSQANVTLTDLKVTDQLTNADGTVTFGTLPEGVRVDGNDPKALIIETLAPAGESGDTVTINCSYTPARDDAGKEIGNTATVTAAVPTQTGTEEKIVNASSDKAQIEKLYQLTIRYVYEDGSEAADKVVAQYLAGETYTYTSPDIAGYTPDLTVVKSVGTGMPKHDVVVTVTYTANDQTYTVNYLEAGANEVLHDPAENKSAKFDQVIDGSREAILIDGYEFDHADPASLTVGTDNTKNVINVYYTKRADLHYEIHYYYDGTEAEDQNVVVNDAIFDAEIPYEANLTGQHDGKSYVLDYAAKTQGQSETRIAWVTGDTTKTVQKETVNVTVAPTVINVYYLLDENGPDHVPDNIPDVQEYHVTYDGNGGTTKIGEASVTDPSVYPAGYTPVYAAPENQFTKADAVFAYWKIVGTDKIIQAEEIFEMAAPGADMTLVAQWKQLTVNKNAGMPTDADGNEKDVFELNDEIPFTIVVKNSGDVALQNVVVTDELEGAVIDGGSGYTVTDNTAVIASLAAGAEVTVNAHYVVTEDEIGRNDITNTAKAEAEGTIGSDTTDPIPMDEVDKQLTVTKEVTNEDEATGTDAQGNQAFTAGDTIEFAITVKNTGNQTLKDIVVEDTLDGAKITGGNLLTNLFNRLVSGYTVEDGKAVIASLKPGESITVTATYVVKEADLGNPNFRNTVTATAGDNTPGTGTTDPIPVEEKNPEYTLTKQIVDAKDEYAPGEEIVYTIVVTNTGNQTLTEVEVTDHLPVVFDEEQLEAESAEVIAADENGVTVRFDEIGIGETKTLTATYTVTEADVLYGSVTNVATAAGKDPEDKPVDPKDPDDGEVTTDTVDPVTDYTVTKTITNPQPQYNVGDTIRYAITVASQANITLENVVVTDQLTDATGVVTFTEVNGATVNADNTVTIAALAPGATVTLNCEYTITREDAGRNIINTASATTDPVVPTDPENPDPIDPGEEESDPTDPAVIENLYNLTIHYVYAAGRTAAPDVTAQFLAGETFTYDSPAIDGYTPDYAFLRSSAEGMPARDVELTVVYTAIPGPAVYVPGTPVIPGVPPTPVPIADAPAAIAALPVPAGTAVPVIPVITIPDDPVPLAGGEITADDEEDDVVIVPVDDPEVPLAGPGDMHHCCILHFLLMLAAVVVYMFYSDDMRRRQKKIAGLTDEYGRETMKRR
ncbi:MAG: DUF11 domain-containing protein [Roseburia sp.]|jgi:uncharacterized repeat protein (TIGR02543 family)/uncharacterized repeat protein (TIGR01451 family)|nr:DUF11 domain-containing protein [Roseburia sp.]